MKLQYLRAFIVLLAGLITLIINMKTGVPVTLSLLKVLIVILIFYIVGTLVVEILQKGLEETDSDSSNSEQREREGQEEQDNGQEQETIAFAFDDDEVD